MCLLEIGCSGALTSTVSSTARMKSGEDQFPPDFVTT